MVAREDMEDALYGVLLSAPDVPIGVLSPANLKASLYAFHPAPPVWRSLNSNYCSRMPHVPIPDPEEFLNLEQYIYEGYKNI